MAELSTVQALQKELAALREEMKAQRRADCEAGEELKGDCFAFVDQLRKDHEDEMTQLRQHMELMKNNLFKQLMAEISNQTPKKKSLLPKSPSKPRVKRANPVKILQDKVEVIEEKQVQMEGEIIGIKGVVSLHTDMIRGKCILPPGERTVGQCANCGSKHKFGTDTPMRPDATCCQSVVCRTAINTANQKASRRAKRKATNDEVNGDSQCE